MNFTRSVYDANRIYKSQRCVDEFGCGMLERTLTFKNHPKMYLRTARSPTVHYERSFIAACPNLGDCTHAHLLPTDVLRNMPAVQIGILCDAERRGVLVLVRSKIGIQQVRGFVSLFAARLKAFGIREVML